VIPLVSGNILEHIDTIFIANETAPFIRKIASAYFQLLVSKQLQVWSCAGSGVGQF